MCFLGVPNILAPFHPSHIQKGGFLIVFTRSLSSLLAQLPSKLGQEPDISYVYLVRALDVPFEDLDFSTPFHPLTSSNKGV